jgi:predicted ArsR family transcriptional regulator
MPRPVTGPGPARRPDGQVAHQLLAHLCAHPRLDFSPHELGKALGLSHGTARRHLLRLADAGRVRRTTHTPARFQIHT